MSEYIIKVSDSNFDSEVLKAELPVLVDFFAEWCAPCRMIGPFVEQIAKEYHGKLKVVKCNIDECPSSAQAFNVSSIPTLIIFKDGKAVQTKMGALPLAQLKAFVDAEL